MGTKVQVTMLPERLNISPNIFKIIMANYLMFSSSIQKHLSVNMRRDLSAR
jgi:hypothetical protein